MIFQYDKCQKGECVSWKNKLMYDDYWGEDPDSIGNSSENSPRKFWWSGDDDISRRLELNSDMIDENVKSLEKMRKP